MTSRLELDLQLATDCPDLPAMAEVERWVAAALEDRRERASLTIRVVGLEEGRVLNGRYRGLDRPTNVLSFPFELPPGPEPGDPIADLLGDLVICAPVVRREALEQGKGVQAHWAHMVVHGVLHLRDYDHSSERDAAEMETLEISILERLGFSSPYRDPEDLEEH